MTLPDERYRAVMWAKRFLESLAHDRKNYPRVPLKVRKEAYSILRHFPNDWDMMSAAHFAPDIFQTKMDPLVRMIKSYDQEQKEEQNGKAV